MAQVIAAWVLFFEKDERTLFALLITPLRFHHYLIAKLATLSALALSGPGIA